MGGGAPGGSVGRGAQAPLISPCPPSNHTITINLTLTLWQLTVGRRPLRGGGGGGRGSWRPGTRGVAPPGRTAILILPSDTIARAQGPCPRSPRPHGRSSADPEGPAEARWQPPRGWPGRRTGTRRWHGRRGRAAAVPSPVGSAEPSPLPRGRPARDARPRGAGPGGPTRGPRARAGWPPAGAHPAEVAAAPGRRCSGRSRGGGRRHLRMQRDPGALPDSEQNKGTTWVTMRLVTFGREPTGGWRKRKAVGTVTDGGGRVTNSGWKVVLCAR